MVGSETGGASSGRSGAIRRPENGPTALFRELLNELYTELVHLEERVALLDKKLARICRANEDRQRLLTIPGVGPLSAAALVAGVGDITVLKNAADLAAWPDLAPRNVTILLLRMIEVSAEVFDQHGKCSARVARSYAATSGRTASISVATAARTSLTPCGVK